MDDKCILDPERDCIGKEYAIRLESRIESLEKWQALSDLIDSLISMTKAINAPEAEAA